MVKFFNPHPGLAGCLIHFPEPLKKVADELNGKKETIENAVALFKEAAKDLGKVKVETSKNYNFIMISLQEENGTIHSWKAIEYK